MFGWLFGSDKQLLSRHHISLDVSNGHVTFGKFGTVKSDQISTVRWKKRSRSGTGLFDTSGRASVLVEFHEPPDQTHVVQFNGATAERDARNLHDAIKRQLKKAFGDFES
jgi:hypothetical protein